jgi:hypothetical protein
MLQVHETWAFLLTLIQSLFGVRAEKKPGGGTALIASSSGSTRARDFWGEPQNRARLGKSGEKDHWPTCAHIAPLIVNARFTIYYNYYILLGLELPAFKLGINSYVSISYQALEFS